MTDPGVSIVICCYNSAERLPQTLAHLADQQVPDHIPWEVIVVDNASTDETATVAAALWPGRPDVSFRVVSQPRPGLSHARDMGFQQACYEFVSFVDDDNWVCPNWVELVYEILLKHPEVGACGGKTEAVLDSILPNWLSDYYGWLAVGNQGIIEGDVTETRGWLWGAGLSVRRSAWQQIQQMGWESLFEGRKGDRLTSGEDNELCYHLRFLGWRLYYSSTLEMTHSLRFDRLTTQYITKMAIANKRAHIINNAYTRILSTRYHHDKRTFLRRWLADIRDHIIIMWRHFQHTILLHKVPGKQTKHDLYAHHAAAVWEHILLGPIKYKKIYRMIEVRKRDGSAIANFNRLSLRK